MGWVVMVYIKKYDHSFLCGVLFSFLVFLSMPRAEPEIHGGIYSQI